MSWIDINNLDLTLRLFSCSTALKILGQIKLTHSTNHRQKKRPKLSVSAYYVCLNSGADTGGVDRVDIHPPFFSKKKFEMSLYLK